MNMNLGLPALSAAQQYSCTVQPKKYLKFLLDWPGLREDNSPKAPKSKKEYETKSKVWLNGQRASNYAEGLFPDLIISVEAHLMQCSKILIKNDGEKQNLYCDVVMYYIFAKLLKFTISFHQSSRKRSK